MNLFVCVILGLLTNANAFRATPLRIVKQYTVLYTSNNFVIPPEPEGVKEIASAEGTGIIPTPDGGFDPDKISPDSFQGFLKENFTSITGDAKGTMSFEQFYKWKQEVGLVYSVEEVADLWENLFTERNARATLKQFIDINFIIDEQ